MNRKLASQILIFKFIDSAIVLLALMLIFAIKAGGISKYIALGGAIIFKNFVIAVLLASVIAVCVFPEGLPLIKSLRTK